MHEFDLIQSFLKYNKLDRPDVLLGPGDDCAIVKIPRGFAMAISVDTSVEGTHFLPGTDPYDIGYKSVAVSLSDAAAMGATPAYLTLTLTLPTPPTSEWLDRFAQGTFELLNKHNIQLIGGDLTRGPLSITTQVHALLPEGKGLKRSGSQVGDEIYVTGTLGDAGLALDLLKKQQPVDPFLLKRLNQPTPRIEIGQALLDIAHSAIDLSDGLVGDLGHILKASGVGAEIEGEKIPKNTSLHFALTAGDDYELCFTAPTSARESIQDIAHRYHTPIMRIGKITTGSVLQVLQSDGCCFTPHWKSYEHF